MEMEDHHHHQYGMPDPRQLMNGRPTHFQAISQGPELFSSGHRNLPPLQPHQPNRHHHFDMMQMVGRQVGHEFMPHGLHHEFPSDSTDNNATPTAAVATVTSASTPSASCGFDGEATAFGGDGGTGRWPRQETLTLLEIRSRLDPKFKEANQKGPLWDEVSRIMNEEHGYQRNGKKCREKFENLYKYYKKTKEGKAGRQDGKHYRFFRQLEALYGETSNSVSGQETHLVGNNFRFHGNPNSNAQSNQEVYHAQKLCDSLSLSNSSEFDTSSDDNDLSTAAAVENDSSEKRKKKRGSSRSWKAKIKEFIDSQMRKLVERQEAWLEKLTKTLEQKEQERILREEEWRKEEAARIDREHKFWAKERAWIEARDAALMESLQNLKGKKFKAASSEELMATEMQNHSENQNENGSETINNNVKADGWQESEISKLIQLRTSMESRFQQRGCSEEILWEEIAAKMVCLGFDRSALKCKDKWDSISAYLITKTRESNKKRKDNSRGCGYYQNNDQSLYSQRRAYCEINDQQGPETVRLQTNDSSSPSNSNAGNAVNDSCFRFLMADGENLWENYGVKLSKGENQ
ncbi:trihelix transcription factor PTL-like [Durio zibethinus]|uniref:Trihelix transcription factor PTL-like n=1 Tax=Durio zibethinus TaxID=66656 RepID=A0A6P5Z5C6_DURZI|nr:trihelix transcription factor PTL-like [Durio zibethinus]